MTILLINNQSMVMKSGLKRLQKAFKRVKLFNLH